MGVLELSFTLSRGSPSDSHVTELDVLAMELCPEES
jgi:hypothetical protein